MEVKRTYVSARYVPASYAMISNTPTVESQWYVQDIGCICGFLLKAIDKLRTPFIKKSVQRPVQISA